MNKPTAGHGVKFHSDASYLSEANAQSRACGHFFMGWKAYPTKPIKLNGAFFTLCAILRFVVASAAEAKLGALFLNCKQATIFRLTLEEMGHPSNRRQYTVITQQRWALQITQKKGKDPDQWKHNFYGLRMQLNKGNLTSNTTQGRKTLATTRASTT